MFQTTLPAVPTREPEAAALSSSQEEAWNFCNRLSQALNCHCASAKAPESSRDAMLRLEILTGGSETGMRGSQVRIRDQGKWHRITITSARYGVPPRRFRHGPDCLTSALSPPRGVRFQEPNAPVQDVSLDATPRCICEHLSMNTTPDKLEHHIILGLGQHAHLSHEQLVRSLAAMASPVTLVDLIAASSEEWSIASQLTLGFILASSLCYLYQGSWVTEGSWCPERIVLHHTPESRVHLQAFLSTAQSVNQAQQSNFFKYPDIRELGMALLEIHLGKPLSPPRPLQGQGTTPWTQNARFHHALCILQDRVGHFHTSSYWDAIDTCLRFDTVAGACVSDQDVREVLFRQVVQPLERDLKDLPLFKTTPALKWADDIGEKIASSDDLAVRIAPRRGRNNNQQYHRDTHESSVATIRENGQSPILADRRTDR